MPAKKVIFDTDPGVDDAMALLFLHLSPMVDLVGISTVHGNGTIETTTRNALFLKQRFNLAAPVARGAAAPLDGKHRAPPTFVHGENGLGDIDLPAVIAAATIEAPAHRFIIGEVRRHPGEITILAVGPLTNLALALREDPGIEGRVREVVVMGGAFGHHGHLGNVTPVAEANMFDDPQAADEVFAAAWPLTVVGLDVTQQTRMSTDYLRALGTEGGEAGRFIWEISRFYEAFHAKSGIEGIFVHDSSAVAHLIEPALFMRRRGALRVVTEGLAIGLTIQKPAGRRFPPGAWDGRPEHAVCVDVDAEGLRTLYRRTILEQHPR